MKNHRIIPIFVPHRGCKNDCIFCNQKKIASSICDISPEDARKIIETYLKTIPKEAYIEVAFYGGSFTGIPIEQQSALLEVANSYLLDNKINGIRLSTRPDYINNEILNNLQKYGVSEIELGVQSLSNSVLDMNNRGHHVNDVEAAVKLIREYKFLLGLQMMTGMYGSNPDLDLYTAREIIKLKPDFVRIYPTLVIRDTFLEELYSTQKYIPQSIGEAAELCSRLLQEFDNNKIKVIRIGLQPTDNIQMGADVVSGPFHPAFRELVQSKLLFNRLIQAIKKHYGLIEKGKKINVKINPSSISKFVGQKRENINRFKQEYDMQVCFIQDNSVKEDDFLLMED